MKENIEGAEVRLEGLQESSVECFENERTLLDATKSVHKKIYCKPLREYINGEVLYREINKNNWFKILKAPSGEDVTLPTIFRMVMDRELKRIQEAPNYMPSSEVEKIIKEVIQKNDGSVLKTISKLLNRGIAKVEELQPKQLN